MGAVLVVAMSTASAAAAPAARVGAVVRKPASGPAKKVAAKKPGLLKPNSTGPAPALAFAWGGAVGGIDAASSLADALARFPVRNGLFTLLIIGSDARPGEPVDRSRGDSVHLLVFNPGRQRGTLIGFPRDSYVDVPGHGKAKLTASLTWGGPTLMMATVSALTNIPVSNYIVTGFAGFRSLIDAVGGVTVLVDPQMNDRLSGATFAKGWFRMNGAAALAYSRNRHDVANGDFGRSANQAKFTLSALAQLRSAVADNRGLLSWIAALRANTTTNLPVSEMLVFAQAARNLAPGAIDRVVIPAKNAFVNSGKARQAIVLLQPAAFALIADVAADGFRGK